MIVLDYQAYGRRKNAKYNFFINDHTDENVMVKTVFVICNILQKVNGEYQFSNEMFTTESQTIFAIKYSNFNHHLLITAGGKLKNLKLNIKFGLHFTDQDHVQQFINIFTEVCNSNIRITHDMIIPPESVFGDYDIDSPNTFWGRYKIIDSDHSEKYLTYWPSINNHSNSCC